ncbi:MAG: ATP-binding protein [bacterium]|nr:ATP-binding protein [bacterium]
MNSLLKHTQPELVEQLSIWMQAQEGEHFEFKEAKNHFSPDDLARYCCALANEGGGRIIFGVTNKRPRRVVGTQIFSQPEDARRKLTEQIPLRIDVLEIPHPDGRVLAFSVASRPVGIPVKYKGIYWAREADRLVPISENRLRMIFAESGHDFSADICQGASLSDLDPLAIDDFRRRWIDRSGNANLVKLTHEQLLRDAEVLLDEGLTYAALILFGTRQTLGRYLAQAEVIFEYRSSEAPGPAQQREEYRQGFFSFYDDLWETINLRNDKQHYQEGLFIRDIPTFEERSVREAILNAVSHRNYQLGGSVFVRQYARRLVLESPGGLPVGITTENILDRQSPRNRRIADVFAKCGLVERSGQGMNLMFEQSIKHGKDLPDFTRTDDYNVVLTLYGQVNDSMFVRFLERISQEQLAAFDTHDFLVLDLVHREEEIQPVFSARLRRLAGLGILEKIGRGRGIRYILSRRFYDMAGMKGVYTRRKGLDRETNKALLLKHLRGCRKDGSPLRDLQQVLPALSRRQIQGLLHDLQAEGRACCVGVTNAARWYFVSAQAEK